MCYCLMCVLWSGSNQARMETLALNKTSGTINLGVFGWSCDNQAV